MDNQDLIKIVTITEIKEAANHVKLFYLQEAGEKIHYRSGQYLTFIHPGTEDELRRSYSLVSSPELNERLCIAVKRIQNGLFSRHLYDKAKPGDQLITLGAGGVFVLPPDIDGYTTLFFFAAGSGIIPIFSLIKTTLTTHPHLRVVLVYSNSSASSTLFLEELKQLEKDYASRLTIEFIFSDVKDLIRSHLTPELIEEFADRYVGTDHSNALYYICGPEAYMRLCTFTLRKIMVPADHIKKEIFDTKKPILPTVPPDTNAHNVTLVRSGKEYSVVVQNPQTILAAAKKEGIMLPYSCEVGRCGNCIAKCEKGKVWMSYNEVLTEKELSQGYILTCTSYPVEGDVVVRY